MWGVLRLDELERRADVLPRVLELLAEERADSADYAWLVMNKIAAHWQEWTEGERTAIEAFIRAWWRAMLSEFPRRLDVFEFLSIVGVMGLDIAPYLSYWEGNSGESGARHLAWLVRDFTVHSAPIDEWYEELDQWIGGPAPWAMLERALAADPGARTVQEISSALDILRSWAHGKSRE